MPFGCKSTHAHMHTHTHTQRRQRQQPDDDDAILYFKSSFPPRPLSVRNLLFMLIRFP